MKVKAFLKTKKMVVLLTIIGILLSAFLLTMSFYNNSFAVADTLWFRDWQDDSESLVVGRLIRSSQAGIWADYGILQRDYDWREENRFVSGNHVEEFQMYPQQIGLQGMVFGLLNSIISLQDSDMIQFLYLLNAIMLAIFILLVALWVKAKFGLLSAIFIVVGCIFSPWLVVSARNLYWVTWTFLLPFVAILYLHWLESHRGRIKSWIFLLAAFLTVFIRVSNGFEFVSAVLITAVLPIIFYAINEKWTFKQYVRRSLFIGLGGLAAFFVALGVNLWQRAMLLGGLSESWVHLQRNILLNTGVTFLEEEATEGIILAFEGPILHVINAYLHRGNPLVLDYRMGELFLVLLMLTLCLFLQKKFAPRIQENQRRFAALAMMTYASLLAPISWFVLARSHSYAHRHINYFLWYFPTVILLLALLGAVAAALFKGIWQIETRRQRLKRCAIVAIVCLLCIWPLLRFYQAWNWTPNTQQLRQVQEQGLVIHHDDDFEIIHYANALYYISPRGVDTSATFFLRAMPVDTEEYPFRREFDFSVSQVSLPPWSAHHVSRRYLPDWEIETIITGQFDASGRLWEITVELR